jgi:4-diphosphocytidyl-2-C-methyl-D-erythritol kinase
MLTLKTFSKINIFLKVCGKISTGYHTIETVFLPLAKPYDEISFSETDSGKITLSSNSDNIPLNSDNICIKAAQIYADKAKINPNWHFHIDKHIPVAAGLGGGSGNAAGVLNLLNSKYNKLTDEELISAAASIGADVPFFINPSFTAAEGIGEILKPVNRKIPDFSLLLINPQFPVSASWAYNNLHPPENETTMKEAINLFSSGNFPEFSKTFRNDLQPAILKKFPILRIIQSVLSENNALASGISGSGPTLFAVFDNDLICDIAADKLFKYFDKSITILKSEPLF